MQAVSMFKIKIVWFIVIFLSIGLWIWHYYETSKKHDHKSVSNYMADISFALYYFSYATVFITYGVNFIKRLKIFKYSKSKYIKKRIVVSLWFLTIPMITQAVYYLIECTFWLVSRMEKSIKDDTYLYPIMWVVLFLLIDFTTVISQVVSILIINKDFRSKRTTYQSILNFRNGTLITWDYSTSVEDFETQREGSDTEVLDSFIKSQNTNKNSIAQMTSSTNAANS